MTLAFEDAYSKFLEVGSVPDADAEECVDDSLVAILKLKLGRVVESEFWSRNQGRGLVSIFEINFQSRV